VSSTEQVSVGALEALRAAEIPPERCGAERTARLSEAERTLYVWILHRFSEGDTPDAATVHEAAGSLGLEPDQALATLAAEDLVHTDPSGRIVVAYPFSGRPTAHRVQIAGGRFVWAMCAIDALGIAPMLDLPIEVRSSDPITGDEIQVQIAANAAAHWQPAEAVVLAGSACAGPSFSGCCAVLNFFSSAASAEQYLREHPDVRGHAISLPEALEAGRLVFGSILEDA